MESEKGKGSVSFAVLKKIINLFFPSFIFYFPFFGGICATIFTKPAITQDLFDEQISTGACWKVNALLNTCTSSKLQ